MRVRNGLKMKKITDQINAYLEWCEFTKKRTPSTMKSARNALRRFLKDTEVEDFRKLTNASLDDWSREIAKRGCVGKTINGYRDHVIGCMKYLQKHQKLSLKFDFELVERAEEDQNEALYFTEDEVGHIRDNCQGLRELLLSYLLFESGMRIAEITKLKTGDLKEGSITVKGKGRKERPVFVHEGTRTMLNQWLNLNGITDGYIFPSPTKFGAPLSIQQVRQTINAPIHRAGLEGSAHAYRHAFGTAMVNNGADIFTVQTILGHARTETTKRYYHTTREQLANKHAQFMPRLTLG